MILPSKMRKICLFEHKGREVIVGIREEMTKYENRHPNILLDNL